MRASTSSLFVSISQWVGSITAINFAVMPKKVSQFEGSSEITHGANSSGNVMVFFSEIDFHVIEKG